MNLGYKDPSIRAVIPVAVNKRSSVDVLGGLIQYLNSNPAPVENKVVMEPVTDFDSPLVAIQAKQLPGFNDQTWIAMSEDAYSKTAEYRNSSQSIRPHEVILRYMVQFFGEFKVATLDNVCLVGDFEEVAHAVGVLTAGSLWPLLDLDWKGFSTNPYSRTAYNFQAETNDFNGLIISAIYPLYDEYCGKKWYCGADGTGLLTDANLTWIVNQESLKSIVTIGDLSRNSYLDDGAAGLDLYYRLCLATVAACKPGAMTALRISMPVNRGLYGIYALFSLFFERVQLLSLKHWAPDDDTCYLIGIKCLQMPIPFMAFALKSNARNQILAYLTQEYTSLGDQLTRTFSSGIEKWVYEVAADWNIRNMI